MYSIKHYTLSSSKSRKSLFLKQFEKILVIETEFHLLSTCVYKDMA